MCPNTDTSDLHIPPSTRAQLLTDGIGVVLTRKSGPEKLNICTNDVKQLLATGAGAAHLTEPTGIVQARVVAVLLQGPARSGIGGRLKPLIKCRSLASILAQPGLLVLITRTQAAPSPSHTVILVDEDAEIPSILHMYKQTANIDEHSHCDDHKQCVGGVPRVAVMQVVCASEHASQHQRCLQQEKDTIVKTYER